MALQDQRQDAVLNRKTSRAAIAMVCIAIAVVSCASVWMGSSQVQPTANALGDANRQSVRQVSWSQQSRDPNRNQSALPIVQQEFARGIVASGNQVPAADEIRNRIAAVENGFLPGYENAPKAGSSRERRPGLLNTVPGSPPPIVVDGHDLNIRLQEASAGLWFDPATLNGTRVVLSFADEGAGLLQAPLAGNGITVDGQYVPPGGSILVGTGSSIEVLQATGVHLRPVALPVRPAGAG